MNLWQAVALGVIQGLTEFIPVSSTAHLLISQKLLGIPASDGMFAFLVIVQWGTLVSLFIFYWRDLLAIAAGVLGGLWKLTSGSRQAELFSQEGWLGIYILTATIPALLAGYLLKDAVETLFRQPLLEASIRLLAAALLLSLAEWISTKSRQIESMTWRDALMIGLMQVIAIFPGASRSGTTIAGGMLRGFDRPAAARFSFLMSVPVMLAAGAYELLGLVHMPGLEAFLPLLAAGFIAAALTGWLAIKWLIRYLGQHSLYGFAGYCAIAGMVFIVLHWVG